MNKRMHGRDANGRSGNENGFIPLLLCILAIVVIIIVFAYMRVAKLHH
ncbi:MAG TPA: hypothetical protein VF261_01520 [Candidatus Saccharimonadales bacterium]